jgi:hypothetical protein
VRRVFENSFSVAPMRILAVRRSQGCNPGASAIRLGGHEVAISMSLGEEVEHDKREGG